MGRKHKKSKSRKGHSRKNTPVSGACTTDAEAADIEATGQASEDWQDTQGHGRKNTPVSGACNTDAEAADIEAAGQASEDWQDTQGQDRKNTPVSGACNTDAEAADVEAAGQASEDWQDTQGHGRKNTPVSGACNTDAVAADIEAAAQASEDWQDTQDADYQKALELAWTDFKNDLIPDELLDRLTEKRFLSYTTIRDIREMKTTTESIEKILKHVHQSGPKKYEVFKECLTLSNQEHLVTVLQEKEREVADDKLKVIPTGKGRKKMPMSGACKNDAEADEQVLEDVQDTQADKKIYLHELIQGSSLHLPEYKHPTRDPELEARCKRLRAQQANKEYMRMVGNVDMQHRDHYSFGNDLKQMNRQLINVFNFVITVGGAFIFAFKAVEYSLGGLANTFALQLMAGLVFGTVVFFADLYFLIKNS